MKHYYRDEIITIVKECYEECAEEYGESDAVEMGSGLRMAAVRE